MKVNLAALLRQSATMIPPKKDVGAYAYMLGEVADHIEMVRKGKATVEEFAQLYCIQQENKS